MERKNFIHKNETFSCEKCKKFNSQASKTCRNHCRYCLFSKHVDQNVPGDRESRCQGLMAPIAIYSHSKKGYQILHQCLMCDKKILNKTADDDNIEMIMKIMQSQNTLPPESI